MVKVMFASGSRSWANNLNDLRERWQLRREEPVAFVVPVELFKEDLSKLSRDDLKTLVVDLIRLKDEGEKALHAHQTAYRLEGVPLPPNLYRDLFSTIRSIKMHIEETKNALSKIKQQEKEALLHFFMEVCRERLPKETWVEIMDEAHARLKRARAT